MTRNCPVPVGRAQGPLVLREGEQVLGRWMRLQREAAPAGDIGAVLDADERAELEPLRRENAELRLDDDDRGDEDDQRERR
jgi:hypothetical protein